jgi:hypothetical protein
LHLTWLSLLPRLWLLAWLSRLAGLTRLGLPRLHLAGLLLRLRRRSLLTGLSTLHLALPAGLLLLLLLLLRLGRLPHLLPI